MTLEAFDDLMEMVAYYAKKAEEYRDYAVMRESDAFGKAGLVFQDKCWYHKDLPDNVYDTPREALAAAIERNNVTGMHI